MSTINPPLLAILPDRTILILYPVPRRKEGNVLFNDALNTFYLRLYGIRHMVKDHSDSERRNLLLPHGLLFPISSNMHHPTDRITHTMAFVTPVCEHWLERDCSTNFLGRFLPISSDCLHLKPKGKVFWK